MRNPNADALRKGSMFKKIVDKCKKANTCFGCDAFNGKVTHTQKGGHGEGLKKPVYGNPHEKGLMMTSDWEGSGRCLIFSLCVSVFYD
jgi:hypothetical protein